MAKPDIVFIAVEPFEHYTWRRRHHVAWRLAEENRVLWIAPPIPSVGLIFPRHYNLIRYSPKTVFDLGRLKYQGRNLWVYCPVQPLPTWHKIPAIARLNKRLVFWNLQRVARRLGIHEPILWLYKNRCDYEYFGLFNEKLIVYDSYDKQTAFIGFDQGKEYLSSVIDWETGVIRTANIVFAVSTGLYEDAKKMNDNCYLIPNGADSDLFETTPTVRIPYLERIKKPILGYLGIMHYMVDFDLLNYVTETRPNWSILFMGKYWIRVPEDQKLFERLLQKRNVHYVGEISREKIPEYLRYVDVCLMPMKRIELNYYSEGPLKLWEYLAAGKPIVAVDQGIEYECHHLVKVASDKEAFVRCTEEMLHEDNPDLVAERKRVARENSWDRRVETMVELIEVELRRHVH